MDRELTVVPEENLARIFGVAAFARGKRYSEQGRVFNLEWDTRAHTLAAFVVGPQMYKCSVGFDADSSAGGATVTALDCNCPIGGGECKHVVAMLLTNNLLTGQGTASDLVRSQNPTGRPRSPEPGGQTATAGTPTWMKQLGPIRTAAQPQRTGATTALALGLELVAAPKWSRYRTEPNKRLTVEQLSQGIRPELHLRPLIPGKKNNWIKGQAGWHWFTERNYADRFEPAQFDWFFHLATLAEGFTDHDHYSPYTNSLNLGSFGSPFLWTLLEQVKSLDIPLVSIDKNIGWTIATHPAELQVDVTTTHNGLAIEPTVTVDGLAHGLSVAWPIGYSGLFLAETTGEKNGMITIARLGTPLTEANRALLESTTVERITVANKDREAFVTDYLPALNSGGIVTSSDASVDIPAEKTPHLDLRLSYGQKDHATLDWSWTYHQPERHYSLIPLPAEARDTRFERDLLRQIREHWPNAARAAAETLADLELARFTARTLPWLTSRADIEVTIVGKGEKHDYRELEAAPSISLRTTESADNDWFDLGITVTVEGREIPFVELFRALARSETHLLLDDGSFFSLDNPAFDRLRELLAEANLLGTADDGRPRISRYQASLYEDFEELADEVEPDAAWAELRGGLQNLEAPAEVVVPEAVNARLRPYQVEGFRWLAFLLQHHLGGILADDMGLGKTLQTLVLIEHERRLRESGRLGNAGTEGVGEGAGPEGMREGARAEGTQAPPFLVVAPTSVVANWVLEARKFLPGRSVVPLAETTKKRKSRIVEVAAGADVIVTSYAVMRLDIDEFAACDWAGVIFDEAQFMKNNAAKIHQAARRLVAPFRLAITGTPMENSLGDVWSLAAVTSPGLFPAVKQFREDYVKPIESGEDPTRMDRLRRRLRPFMLRRTKELVAADLPEKQEQVLAVDLEPQHRRLYDTVLQKERKQILGLMGDFDKNRFTIFRSLTLLRMLALDPSIVAEHADSGIASSKSSVLMEQLGDVIAEGHRSLVFSQFTSYLRSVAAELDAQGIDYVYLDGSTRDRTAVVSAFRDGQAPVFLISLKAGGFGLTLTEADYVFLLDPWWNPAAENQAIDRTHRIGQQNNVMVYRLVARNTIEEKVLALQQKKAELFTSLMDEGGERVEGGEAGTGGGSRVGAFSEQITAADIRGLLE